MRGLLQAVRQPSMATDALGEPLDQFGSAGIVGEQRPSLADAPKLHEVADGLADEAPPPRGREGLFTYDGPLRRNGDDRPGRMPQPGDTPHGAKSLINRFRRPDGS